MSFSARRLPLAVVIRSRHRPERLSTVLLGLEGKFDQWIVVEEEEETEARAVATSFGAEYFSGENAWTQALERLTTPWALWMDSGEKLVSTEVDALRDWFEEVSPKSACFCHVRSVDDSWGRGSHCLQVRLFPTGRPIAVVGSDVEGEFFHAFSPTVIAPVEFVYDAGGVFYDANRFHERNIAFFRERTASEARRSLRTQLFLARRFEDLSALLDSEETGAVAHEVDDPSLWRALIALSKSDPVEGGRWALSVARRHPSSGLAYLLLAKASFMVFDYRATGHYVAKAEQCGLRGVEIPWPRAAFEFERLRLKAAYFHSEALDRIQAAHKEMTDAHTDVHALWSESAAAAWRQTVVEADFFAEHAGNNYWLAAYLHPQWVDLMVSTGELEAALLPLLPPCTSQKKSRMAKSLSSYVAALNVWREFQERTLHVPSAPDAAAYTEGTLAERGRPAREALIRRLFAGCIRLLLDEEWFDSVSSYSLLVITKAMEAFPNEGSFVFDHAQWLFKSGKLPEGLREVRRALSLEPDSVELAERAAHLLSENGHQTTAALLVRRYWERFPKRYDVALLGTILAQATNQNILARKYLLEMCEHLRAEGVSEAASWEREWSPRHPLFEFLAERASALVSEKVVAEKVRRLALQIREFPLRSQGKLKTSGDTGRTAPVE